MHVNLTKLLNEEQARAAAQISGPVLIIAGAGSGKTRMLCCRIAHMLQSGVHPKNILALTFTNKAAMEMAHRVRTLVKQPLDDLETSTFHAFGLRILKQYGHLLGYNKNFTIYDSADSISLMKEVLLEENFDVSSVQIKELLHLFSSIKTGRTSWTHDASHSIRGLYDAYRSHMKVYNAVDFDDLLMLPIDLFERYPDVLEIYRNQFTHIMVDEFQDTSFEQYTLVHMIAEKQRNICVVGDDDQSIYSWRGANYKNIELFEKDFPELVEIKLERNYRSTGTILQAANELISHNSMRKEKALWTESDSGNSITMLYPDDEETEIRTVINEMRRLSYERHINWDAFGILVRTNHLIPAIENVCMLESIPISVSGGQSFFERKEIKDTIAYLRVLANPNDDMALLRIINTPRRKIGRVTLQRLRSLAETHHCSLYSAICLLISTDGVEPSNRNESLKSFIGLIDSYRNAILSAGKTKSSILNKLMEEIEYKHFLKLENPENEQIAEWRYKSIETFIRMFSTWEKDDGNEENSLYDYLNKITLHNHEQTDDEQKIHAVSVMTMHAAKGLEFDTVFLLGIEDHIIPHARTIEEHPEAIEEERRLFYVALTRARKLLYISSCKVRKRNREFIHPEPSRFIAEISQHLLQSHKAHIELKKDETVAAFQALKRLLAQKESS